MAVEYAGSVGEAAAARRVNWGAVFAGGVMALSVTTIVYLLGMAITLVATDVGSFGAALIALAIILIVATILGGAFGGSIAGAASGSRLARMGGMHGLLSSAVAFLVATFFCMLITWKVVGAAGSAVATTAQTAAQATTTTAAGAAQGGNSERILQSLGYSAAEARQMVNEAQRSVQRLVRGGNVPTGAQVQQEAANAGNSFLHYLGGAIWLYFGTWLLAMLAAIGGGILGARRVPVGNPIEPRRERIVEREQVRTPSSTPPFRPSEA